MKKGIVLLLISLILLSGCTIPFFHQSENPTPQPIKISLESDLTRVRANDITYLYLILDNLDKKEKYDVSATIMNPGIFEIDNPLKHTTISGLMRKELEWKLKAPKVKEDTPSPVSVEITISKTFDFTLPIFFANPAYLREREQAGKPISKKPKSYYFSDNLVNVEVELNKAPPIDTGEAYANIKVTPTGGGILKFNSINVGDGASCEEVDEHTNSVSCTFSSGSVEKIKEKKFKIEIRYEYKETKSLSFTILHE